ncbi:hypothetical protein IKG33_03385 [Candidatus Saccharibacteria bacterium]|nr:hypothetical protein [Candidatus Saccharibacteria bacterium]
MADRETELEWEKSKRIEAEKMKAERALEETKPDKANYAFLEPKTTKVKGWSADKDVILADSERMGNRSAILALSGVVLNFIGDMGAIVSESFNLGMAGVILNIPSWVGIFCFGLAILMAGALIGCEIYFRIKKGRKFSVGFWSALGAAGIVLLYVFLRWLMMRIH